MCTQLRLRRDLRRNMDQSVRRCLEQMSYETRARHRFAWLLADVRRQSDLLRPRRHAPFDVAESLMNLARRRREWLRTSEDWSGGFGNPHALLASLASHLLGDYPVPSLMAGAWIGPTTASRSLERNWFIAHARGRPIRRLSQLPFAMTRKMERIFLRGPAHLPVLHAMRRAEFVSLDAHPSLVDAVLATPLASESRHGEFWRSVAHFFVNHWGDLQPYEIEPIVRFLYGVRFVPHRVLTRDGPAEVAPPEPHYSLHGRSPASVRRQVIDWESYMLDERMRGARWAGCGLKPAVFPDPSRRDVSWHFVELRCAGHLRSEGARMRHCVGSYVWRCRKGISSIWSLRRRAAGELARPVMTVEIEPRSKRVVQAKAFMNQVPGATARRFLEAWAKQQGLRL